MKATLTSADLVDWTAYYLAVNKPEAVQKTADEDVEDVEAKLKKAFGKRQQ